MLSRSRQDEVNGSKSRKISRINRGTTCDDIFGMHETHYVCDACPHFFYCNRTRKIGKDENNTKCQQLWKSEHDHTNFSFRALKHNQIYDYLNVPARAYFKN